MLQFLGVIVLLILPQVSALIATKRYINCLCSIYDYFRRDTFTIKVLTSN